VLYFFVFDAVIHKLVRPADTNKIANLAQHPKTLGTAGLSDSGCVIKPLQPTKLRSLRSSAVYESPPFTVHPWLLHFHSVELNTLLHFCINHVCTL